MSTPCFLGASGGDAPRPTSPGPGARERSPQPDYGLLRKQADKLKALWEDTTFQSTFHDRDQFEYRLRPNEEL